jgi:hypothetical protein
MTRERRRNRGSVNGFNEKIVYAKSCTPLAATMG